MVTHIVGTRSLRDVLLASSGLPVIVVDGQRLLMAREMSSAGVSLRGVRFLAGHSALSTTQRYIESDGVAQRRVVEMV